LSFLLDTNVVSETFKRRPNAKVIGWLQSVPPVDVYLSVITLGEIHKGIELARIDSEPGAARLETWLQSLAMHYRARILLFDEAVADRWGRIMAAHPAVPPEDGQLAATALHHGLTFVTRNVRDIAPTGVPHFNPF
jgi:predicted nucleic acid-binding protein